ncbi:unnamed protein product [Moneuplotes crassus]|uniref:UDENN domain-containing protein n=1 Tax=Euplotes crassus TaxID=5936 RepID=A0AAD2CZ24_EUPCR|nr:unnamed protein product [Moneuplotes crassus]
MEIIQEEGEWTKVFNSSNPLIDYFIMSGSNVEQIYDTIKLLKEDCEKIVPSNVLPEITPDIICRVPEVDRPEYQFPISINDLAFINGYKLATNFKDPKFIPLVLTGDKGTKKFVQVMIFWENLASYLNINIPKDISTTPSYSASLNKYNPTNPNPAPYPEFQPSTYLEIVDSKKSIHKRDYSCNVVEKRPSLTEETDQDNLDALNSSMIQIITDYIDQRDYENSEKTKVFDGKEYFIPKAMMLISSLPIFDVMQEMLLTLYKQAIYRINYPIDAYIYYLTYEVPLACFGTNVKISLPNLKEKTITDSNYNIEYLCKYFSNPYLSFKNLYKVLYWFMCQAGNTLLVSNDASKLVVVSEVLRAIIYPFTYDDPYVPLLAPNMIKSIEAPFPCHLGLLDNKSEFEVESIISSCSDNTMVILLDSDELAIRFNGENMTMQEYYTQEEIIDFKKRSTKFKRLPDTNLNKLTIELEKCISKFDSNQENSPMSKTDFVNDIRGYFLQYFADLFKNYLKYFTRPKNLETWDLKDVFNQDLFLKNDNSETDFFKDFFATRTWVVFLETKIIPDTVEQVQIHKHFDQCIKNLSKLPLFFATNVFKGIEKSKEIFTYSFHPEKFNGGCFSMKNDYINCMDINDLKIDQFIQTIEIQDRGQSESEMRHTSFSKRNHYIRYVVFPAICESLIPCSSNFAEDRFAPDLSKTYSLKNNFHDLDKHLSQRKGCTSLIQVRTKGQIQNIYIIWIMMWILNFEYLQADEKKFRMEQICGIIYKMLKIADIQSKNLILEDLFETILEHGRFDMIEELYEFMRLLNIKGNAKLDHIFFNAIRKHNEILDLKKQEKTIREDLFEDIKINIQSPSRTRTSVIEHHDSEFLDSKTQRMTEFGLKPPSIKKKMLSFSPVVSHEIGKKERKKRLVQYTSSVDLKSEYYQEKKETFQKRTFKREKDMHNFLVPDTLFLHIEAICDNCDCKIKYKGIIKGMKNIGFECISCKQDILPEIIATIGGPSLITPVGIGSIEQEEQLLISEKELRILVNRLYESVQIQKKEKMFDLIIFRQLKGQLFWNCIFYFMHYGLPYDCLLPYSQSHISFSDFDGPKITAEY